MVSLQRIYPSGLFLLLGICSQFSVILGEPWIEPHNFQFCPYEGQVNISFRNYCEIYTHCEYGTSRLDTCPDGLHFHPLKGSCDLPRNVKGCDLLDAFAPTTAAPSEKIVDQIKQNFDCDPVDIITKRRGKRKCKVQVICANGISFILKRCMQTISFKM